ncbi:MAG: hypothetical protein Q8N04_18000 [Nitrospira sp.]|nr:hypothetical protein [Nitrospira sp.]
MANRPVGVSSETLELKYKIEMAERRFNDMRQLVEAKGYDWDMIDLKRMQRELDDLIKRYEERMSKQLGCRYRYGSSAVAPQVGTHPFEHQAREK